MCKKGCASLRKQHILRPETGKNMMYSRNGEKATWLRYVCGEKMVPDRAGEAGRGQIAGVFVHPCPVS